MWRGPVLSILLHGGGAAAIIATGLSLWPALQKADEPRPVLPGVAVTQGNGQSKVEGPLTLSESPSALRAKVSSFPYVSAPASPGAIGDTGFSAVVVYVDSDGMPWHPPSRLAAAGANRSERHVLSANTATSEPPASRTAALAPQPTPENLLGSEAALAQPSSPVELIPASMVAAVQSVRAIHPRLDREDAQGRRTSGALARLADQRAVERYRRAAEAGRSFARYNLALAYLNGRGAEHDPTAAAQQFRKAAKRGHAPAMLRLAELHLAGFGVPQDAIEAAAWYQVAGANGDQAAWRAAAIINSQLPLEEQTATRKRAMILNSELPPERTRDWRELDQALLAAIKSGDRAGAKTLLDQGADGNAADIDGRNGLITAAWRGYTQIASLLIDAGVNIDSTDDQGRTAVMWASINGYRELVRMLASTPCSIDAHDNAGLTPLMRAAWNGHGDVVRELLRSGADPRRRDNAGLSALDRAKQFGDPVVVTALQKAARSL